MWICPTVQQLLNNFINLCLIKNINTELNQDTFMFGEYKTKENIRQNNVLVMLVKQYIYRSRCFKSNLSVIGVLHEIESYIKAIKNTIRVENKMNEINNRWEIWQHLFT